MIYCHRDRLLHTHNEHLKKLTACINDINLAAEEPENEANQQELSDMRATLEKHQEQLAAETETHSDDDLQPHQHQHQHPTHNQPQPQDPQQKRTLLRQECLKLLTTCKEKPRSALKLVETLALDCDIRLIDQVAAELDGTSAISNNRWREIQSLTLCWRHRYWPKAQMTDMDAETQRLSDLFWEHHQERAAHEGRQPRNQERQQQHRQQLQHHHQRPQQPLPQHRQQQPSSSSHQHHHEQQQKEDHHHHTHSQRQNRRHRQTEQRHKTRLRQHAADAGNSLFYRNHGGDDLDYVGHGGSDYYDADCFPSDDDCAFLGHL
jgi:hypothetical protein